MNEPEIENDTSEETEELHLDNDEMLEDKEIDDNEIEEYEDISGADRAAESERGDDYDETSSSSSDSGDDNDSNKSNRTGILDETSNCSNTSNQNLSESEDISNGEISSVRNIYTKRTQHSVPYNFKLMTQELSPGQSKFMENFDPERSNREKRKLTRKISSKKSTLYDDDGLMGMAQLDVCDCMSEECPGCHFPCTKCFSNKCGHECRQNRRWLYEEIHIEGTDLIIQNSAYSANEQG